MKIPPVAPTMVLPPVIIAFIPMPIYEGIASIFMFNKCITHILMLWRMLILGNVNVLLSSYLQYPLFVELGCVEILQNNVAQKYFPAI